MLSPSVDVVDTLLTQSFNETLRLDAFSQTAGSILIGRLPKDPDWLASVRNRIGMLGTAGAAWIKAKPDIWGSVLLQFTDYASAFAGVAALQKDSSLVTADQWTAVLGDVLLPQLRTAATATDAASTNLRSHLAAFANIQPLLAKSIDAGWQELAGEEQEMVAIATQLAHLQDLVESLEQSITGIQISTGKSVGTTTVTTLYSIAAEAGGSFSFLSMAASAFTVGKTYYDIITHTAEIGETLQRIGELQMRASDTAQAAAGTKMVLRLVYDLQLSISRMIDIMPQIATMWRSEMQKVQAAIAALAAGVDPATYLELFTVPSANAAWQSVNGFARKLPTIKTVAGPPVLLDPRHPLVTQR